MIVQNPMVKGGIAAVAMDIEVLSWNQILILDTVESYKDGGKFDKNY